MDTDARAVLVDVMHLQATQVKSVKRCEEREDLRMALPFDGRSTIPCTTCRQWQTCLSRLLPNYRSASANLSSKLLCTSPLNIFKVQAHWEAMFLGPSFPLLSSTCWSCPWSRINRWLLGRGLELRTLSESVRQANRLDCRHQVVHMLFDSLIGRVTGRMLAHPDTFNKFHSAARHCLVCLP